MSLVIVFYFTSCMLNMFRTLTQSSSGACYMDTTPTQPHWNSNTHRNKVGAISNSQHQSTLAKHRQSTNKIRCTHENT